MGSQGGKEGLLFCEQKRSKKNFGPAGCGKGGANARKSESFLLLFFKKEALAFAFFASASRGCRLSPA
jgi:hypothetical protein